MDAGGYKTVTTRERINEYSPLTIWVTDGQWYITRESVHESMQKKDPAVFLYEECGVYFSSDLRCKPEDVAGNPLVRQSVHKRMQAKETAAEKKASKVWAALLRQERNYASWILANGSFERAFQTALHRIRQTVRNEAQVEVGREHAENIDHLKRAVSDAHFANKCLKSDLEKLEAQVESRQLDIAGHNHEPDTRVIELS